MAKTYFFSVAKHAHDIELYYNRLYNTKCAMEMGEISMDAGEYDRICDELHGRVGELRDMMYQSRDGYTVQLTGPQIGLAKQIVAWAAETRAASLISAGKFQYLQYV